MDSPNPSRRRILHLGVFGAGAAVLSGCAGNDHPYGTQEVSELAHVDKSRLADFIALSEELTGVAPLSEDLALQYLHRMAANPIVGPLLPDLLDAYVSIRSLDAEKRSQAMSARVLAPTAALRPVAEQLTYLWYTSAFAFRDQANPSNVVWQYGSEAQYNRALIWHVIEGHPPMTTPSTWTDRPAG